MNSNTEDPSSLAQKILEAENRLDKLGQELSEIGMPAASELGRRLDALKVEEKALKRNFEESLQKGEPDSVRSEKIEQLLEYIRRQETSMKREADFLNQSVPTSASVIAETGAHVVDLLERGIKHVVGDHHPLGSSVFVNHSHENLVDFHGLEDHKTPFEKSAGESHSDHTD